MASRAGSCERHGRAVVRALASSGVEDCGGVAGEAAVEVGSVAGSAVWMAV